MTVRRPGTAHRTTTPPPDGGVVRGRYEKDQVLAALNRAADDIGAAGVDQPTRDALNLFVNTVAHYLDHPDEGLVEAIEAMYDEPFYEVLSWIEP